MAYKKAIAKPDCSCGRKARYEVINNRNASLGYYCATCANRKVRELNARGA